MKKWMVNGIVVTSFAALLVACSEETDTPTEENGGQSANSGNTISKIQDRGELIMGPMISFLVLDTLVQMEHTKVLISSLEK